MTLAYGSTGDGRLEVSVGHCGNYPSALISDLEAALAPLPCTFDTLVAQIFATSFLRISHGCLKRRKLESHYVLLDPGLSVKVEEIAWHHGLSGWLSGAEVAPKLEGPLHRDPR